MKVLITGGKSALALKMLKAFAQHQVVLADYGEMPNFSATAYKFISLGKKNEDTIAHNLLNTCLDEQADMVLPLHKFEIEAIAKADVLFNEFNIEVLLCKHDDLNTYFDQQTLVKSQNWVLFRKGEVFFATFANEELAVFGKRMQLNGAYYFKNDSTVANLTLITI